MRFTKMQGIGNDYVYINCFEETVKNPEKLAIKLSERHYGVGSDGLILIKPSEIADCEMEMYNADGSRSEMCGNGIRCVGKFVYDRGIAHKSEIRVETLAGIKTLYIEDEDGKAKNITVNMGVPELLPERIPVNLSGDRIIDREIKQNVKVTCVSMGNPHTVIFVKDTALCGLESLGSEIEKLDIFPNRTNVEFIQCIDRHTLKMRVWERGSGETMACGTGACASLVAGVLNGVCERNCKLELLGGDLFIRWDEESSEVFMTGGAEFVFDGELL